MKMTEQGTWELTRDLDPEIFESLEDAVFHDCPELREIEAELNFELEKLDEF